MKPIIYIAYAILIFSCSSAKYIDSDVDKISIDMGILNQRLHGYLYRKKMNKDLSNLDVTLYLESVREITEPSEIEYTNLLAKKGVEYRVKGEKKDFKICIKDPKPLLILCDIGSTPFVEKIYKSDAISIDEAIGKLP